MNHFRIFTIAHTGDQICIRADAVDSFFAHGKGTEISLRGTDGTAGIVVAEDFKTVLEWIENEDRT